MRVEKEINFDGNKENARERERLSFFVVIKSVDGDAKGQEY